MLVLVIVAPTLIALIALAAATLAIRRAHRRPGALHPRPGALHPRPGALHRRLGADQLSDDWWPQFEQAFRDYVRSRSSSAS